MCIAGTSHHQEVAPCKEIQIPESRKYLLMESGHKQIFPETSGILGSRNPESMAWNPESKTVLDFATWSERGVNV